MQRVTPTDRDRAVRKLSVLTGGITAVSVALTGAFMVLAKHETDSDKARRAQLSEQRRAAPKLALSGQTALVDSSSRAAGSSPSPTVHVYTSSPAPTGTPTATRSSTPTSRPTVTRKKVTRTATSTAKRTTATRTTSAPGTTSRPAPTTQAPEPTQPQQEQPAPTSEAPQPVQSSGS